MQHSLIQELMLHEFVLVYNVAEATKTLCVQGDGTVDHSTVQEILLRLQKHQ